MALICDCCGKIISTIHFIRKDLLSFCSYRCFKNVYKIEDEDYYLQKKRIGRDLLGIKSNIKKKEAFLPDGAVTSHSMVWAAGYERAGDFKKAINCWKRIQILHSDDKTIIARAKNRIDVLEQKLKSKVLSLNNGRDKNFGK
jgi:hypothetical protein